MTQAETRRLAALMFTDLVGCSRQRGAAEVRPLRVLESIKVRGPIQRFGVLLQKCHRRRHRGLEPQYDGKLSCGI